VLQLQDQNTNIAFVKRIGWGGTKKRLEHKSFRTRNEVPKPPLFSLSRQIVQKIITNTKQGKKEKGIVG
jgi:hypothetical protein